MNASLIPTIVLSLFLLCIIVGFVFGWCRGFSKALLRFIIVVAVSVLAFFVVPAITTAVLKMDISKFNINIDGVQVLTLGELVSDLLAKIPFMEDLIQSSPTFEAVITLAPQIIVNVVLFVLFFFLFKWVSMIIYWIFAGIFFSKKKLKDKDRHKFVGAVIGAVQGLIVALVVMIPVFGMVETTRPVVEAMKVEQSAPANQNSFNEVYVADDSNNSNNSNSQTIDQLSQVGNEASKYIEVFDKTWIVKVFSTLKLKDLSVSMFDYLTTVENKSLKVSLRKEVNTIAKVYPHVAPLLEGTIDLEQAQTYESLHGAIDELYESKIVSGIVEEIVPVAAARWLDGERFCDFSRPNLGDASMNKMFNALLLNLSTSDGASLKVDLLTTVDIMKELGKSGLIKCFMDNGDIMEVLTLPKNDDLISNIIDIALESSTIKAILPDLLNVAMNKVYVAFNLSNIPEIVAPETINWDTEKVILKNIFSNTFNIYKDIENGKQESKTALECVNFGSLGHVFDDLRRSVLFGPSSLSFMNSLLESDFLVGTDSSILEAFKNELISIWANDSISMADTFVSLHEAIVLAKDLQSNATDFNTENLGQIIESLASNEGLKTTVNKLLEDKTVLQNLGLDEQTAGVVSETISSVINHDYETSGDIKTEIKAVQEVFDVANKVINAGEEKVELDQTETTTLINSIASSTVIKDKLIAENSEVGNLNFAENLSEDTKTNLINSIDAIEEAQLDADAKLALKNLFGL